MVCARVMISVKIPNCSWNLSSFSNGQQERRKVGGSGRVGQVEQRLRGREVAGGDVDCERRVAGEDPHRGVIPVVGVRDAGEVGRGHR